MPRIRNRSGFPYGGGYALDDKEKGMVGFGSTFGMIVESIRAYRNANAIPVGLDFENEVEREVCAQYPAECDESSPLVPPRTRTVAEIIQGTRNLFAFKMAGSPLVGQEEANRRAAVCVKCPHNINIATGCGGICGELKQIVDELVGGKGTPSDVNLHSCGICSCYLTAAVWMPTSFQVENLPEGVIAQFQQAKQDHGCWKLGV